jgi:hypothetical protein
MTYAIAPDGGSITCHRCGMTSHHPKDVAERYCGKCKRSHDDEALTALPRRLLARPRDAHGFPITYVTLLDNDGKPDFRIVDEAKLAHCLRARLCGVCGQLLGRHLFFIGGPLCVASRLFLDPPMHRECAIFALQACPHLANAKSRFSTRGLPEGEFTVTASAIASDEKCEWFALMHTGSYTFGRTSSTDPKLMIKAGEWFSVEKWRDGAPMQSTTNQTEQSDVGYDDTQGSRPEG